MNTELKLARTLLDEAERVLHEAELINDSVEGWLGTKEKPSVELDLFETYSMEVK